MIFPDWLKQFIEKVEIEPQKSLELLKVHGVGARGTPKSAIKLKAIEAIINHFANLKILQIANSFIGLEDDTAKEISAHLLAEVYLREPECISNKLKRLADDDNWEVREWVASAVGSIVTNHFSSFHTEALNWANDTSPNVRRAIAVAVKYASKTRNEHFAEPFLDIVEMLLTDSNTYVKKNLGPFVLGDGLLKYFPEFFLTRLEKWIEIDNEHARWNIAKVFSAAEGIKYVQHAEHVLKVLANDERVIVKRAFQSTLNQIKQKDREAFERIAYLISQESR
ncbi:3-methyladenine DNA glycosylase AlkD [Salirhabdus euzebyi]|uniref:3-methyladenine DNA glycosylase AlkD n=1 Tax=Salirhabdus euzebyi TaxID=394506 RepID=A0A841Q7H0_9BACI|nr:DNA alkylation repair protein [Salirhabdus euzebyi]MBB6454325.1 3-methyladenine DNA glycosylase AlkD [Salirhabdus euzebyi]